MKSVDGLGVGRRQETMSAAYRSLPQSEIILTCVRIEGSRSISIPFPALCKSTSKYQIGLKDGVARAFTFFPVLKGLSNRYAGTLSGGEEQGKAAVGSGESDNNYSIPVLSK